MSIGTNPSSLKGGGRRENRTEHQVNEAQVHWDDELELYEEYAALVTTEGRPRYDEGRRPKDREQNRDRNRTQDRYNKGNGERKESREQYVIRVFCTAPCACCGSDKHAMLSPIKAPDGTPLNSEYICPVAMCESWEEARQLKPPKLKFTPCPKKFATAHKNDTNLVHAAIKNYTEKGSGKFRDADENLAFKNEVLGLCKTPSKSTGGTRVVGSVNKEERCNSGQIEIEGQRGSLRITAEQGNSSYSTKVVRSVTREERCNSMHIELATDQEDGSTIYEEHPINEEISEERDHEGCVIIETYNAQGVTKAPSPLTHSSLHLMVASKVEPSSKTEIKAFLRKDFEETISRKFEEDNGEDGLGCWVLMEMTYGAEYIVPYKSVHGRILADTGSTTTLINEEYILLGTRDLERYKIDVSSHRGEAKMELREGTVAFPMLDATQITHLQQLALGGGEDC